MKRIKELDYSEWIAHKVKGYFREREMQQQALLYELNKVLKGRKLVITNPKQLLEINLLKSKNNG